MVRLPSFRALAASAVPCLLWVPIAVGQDARSVLEEMRARQAARWGPVSNYTVTLAVEAAGGMQAPMHYEKITMGGEPAFRLVPQTEYERRIMTQAGFPPPGADVAKGLATGYDLLGDAFARGGEGAPPMDVRPMTDQMAMFLRAGAAYRENDGRADARDAKADMAEFVSRARLLGVEPTEGGREAFHIVADDLFDIPLAQPKGGGEYRLEKVSLWIDTVHYVPIRLLMDGQVTRKNTITPISIERLDLEYRRVGPLYESHRQVMRLTGLMAGASSKDRKDMEKARKDIAKAKAQLDAMPEGPQKDMIVKMMKPQIEKFERMAAAGAFEAVTRVVRIAVNEGPPTAYGTGTLAVGATTFPGALSFAADQVHGGGSPVATLTIAARQEGVAEATIVVYGGQSFFTAYGGDGPPVAVAGPGTVGSIAIRGASGRVQYADDRGLVTIEGGAGTITVARRTGSRVVGTFDASLTTAEGDVLQASGRFDTGAPTSADVAPRGSPFPAYLSGGH